MNEPRPERAKNAATALIDRRMREQSLRVPWSRLAAAVDQIVEWRAFSLWVRAIAETETSLPEFVREAIEERCPGFLQGMVFSGTADTLWTELLAWSEQQVFTQAMQDGWIEAAHYYSGLHPRSEQAWQQWERSTAAWACTKPARYPFFTEWWTEAQEVDAKLEDPLVEHAIEMAAYSYWAVLTLVTDGDAVRLRQGIDQRCPTFLHGNQLPAGTDSDGLCRFREALEAALVLRHTPHLDEVRAAAHRHLRFLRIEAYFSACSEESGVMHGTQIPAFETWLQQADDFVIAP